MPHRLLSNALLLTLTLGGLTLGGCAYDRSSEPGYAWSYMENADEGPKLAYGRPNSDDVVMMMACAPRASSVTLTATSLMGDEIALASGHVVTRLKASAAPSDMSEGLLQARTTVDASALRAFRRTGDLDLLVADERHSLDAAPADQRQVKAFFKACGV
jgi:methyl coenzyme M reductase alpha subunit